MSDSQTNNLSALKNQMDQQGFCIIRDVIPKDIIGAIHRRVDAQARAEKALELTTQDQVQTDNDKKPVGLHVDQQGRNFPEAV